MITIKNLCKKYGTHCVLNEVDIHFNKNMIHGIIGRNGSGKTVFFKAICGITDIDSGQIYIDNQLVVCGNGGQASVGAIIGEAGFVTNMSGASNLWMLASIRRQITKSEVYLAMEKVGLDPQDRKTVGKYSLGMKQRLAIAQAIMEKPSLLILDEPMNGLDKNGVNEIRDILRSLRSQGVTILMASHNPIDIDELCDAVYEMDAGRLTRIR